MAMPMLVAPVAGALADKIGNKPFMLLGLVLQGAGLGWLAFVAGPEVSYGTLVAPLIIAGVGIAMCFPTVANAVTASVPPADVGVAAGTNNALNALGGVFGIAILAAVFAAHGSYASPAMFISGFKPAEWVAAAVAATGVIAAALARPNRRSYTRPPQCQSWSPHRVPLSDPDDCGRLRSRPCSRGGLRSAPSSVGMLGSVRWLAAAGRLAVSGSLGAPAGWAE